MNKPYLFVVETQSEIIRHLSEATNELYAELMQYKTVEEMDNDTATKHLNEAERLRKKLGNMT